jgi:hypothetical protein
MRLLSILLALVIVVGSAAVAVCCPFCSAVSMTFCEEIGQADAAVFAKLTTLPPQSSDGTQNATATIEPAGFDIVEVLKGADIVGSAKSFETLYFGAEPVGKEFLVMAMHDQGKLAWTTPIPITPAVKPYLKTALTLPKEGADRLVFFQDYLEGGEEMLARDAYDEFAKAPYKDVLALKGRMKHDQLVKWVKDAKISPSHRRLYLTMLGVCGNDADVAMFEQMLKDDSPAGKPGMDALVAAYLKLKGAAGLPLIEDLFLKNADAEYTETYAAIMAIRFHGQEDTIIPKKRLIEALRYMLARPQLADLVIPDLARWEDWGSADRMVQLFKESDDESGWVRVPVINFLRACPLPEAKKHLEELAKLDPESMQRANSFFPLGGGVAVPQAEGSEQKAKAEPADAKTEAADDKENSSAEAIPDASKFVEPKPATEAKKPEPNAGAAVLPTPENPVAAAATLVRPHGAGDGARSPIATRQILGSLALTGLALFVVMAAVVRGGQHVNSSGR